MKPLELRTKIILFTSLLVIAVVAGSFLVINQVVKSQVRNQLVRDLQRSQQTLEQSQKDRLREMAAYSIIASENSTLKAAIETYQTELQGNSPILEQLRRTVENEASKLFVILKADLLVVTSNGGEVLALESLHTPKARTRLNLSDQPSIQNCLSPNPRDFEQSAGIWRFQEQTYRIVSVPILLQDLVIGTLSSGYEISPQLVGTIKQNTGSDVVFVAGDQIIASTFNKEQNEVLSKKLKAQAPVPSASESQTEVSLQSETFLALQIAEGSPSGGGFIILNSIDRAMQNIMGGIKVTLIFVGLFSILIAMSLGLALSQSITQPLMNFVNFMGGITRTGELQHKFLPQRPNYEVTVLARSFESMAQSLAESQAESGR